MVNIHHSCSRLYSSLQ